MALMMDNKPTEYKGEALVWEKLYSLALNKGGNESYGFK